MPTSNVEMLLSSVKDITTEGRWELMENNNDPTELSQIWCHTAPNDDLTVLEVIQIYGDDDNTLPYTGMYRRYPAGTTFYNWDRSDYTDEQWEAMTMQEIAVAHFEWGSESEVNHAMPPGMTMFRQGNPLGMRSLETHSWPEGYATLHDLLAACGIEHATTEVTPS